MHVKRVTKNSIDRWHTDSEQCSEPQPQTAAAKATGSRHDGYRSLVRRVTGPKGHGYEWSLVPNPNRNPIPIPNPNPNQYLRHSFLRDISLLYFPNSNCNRSRNHSANVTLRTSELSPRIPVNSSHGQVVARSTSHTTLKT